MGGSGDRDQLFHFIPWRFLLEETENVSKLKNVSLAGLMEFGFKHWTEMFIYISFRWCWFTIMWIFSYYWTLYTCLTAFMSKETLFMCFQLYMLAKWYKWTENYTENESNFQTLKGKTDPFYFVVIYLGKSCQNS